MLCHDSEMFLCIDHVGIAVHDLDEQIAFYVATFGLSVVSRDTHLDHGVHEAMLEVGPQRDPAADAVLLGGSYVQLVAPTHADSPVGRFLDRRGPGLHHVGYRVADIAAALAVVADRGVRRIDERARHGSMGASIAFLHPNDVGGVLTELVQAAR